jgi:5'-deoxynucleotidase YfbR-like HD superfamily hydrolase
MREVKELIAFFLEAIKLKSTIRKGWVRVGVKDPESVAEHSYSLALLAMVLGKKLGFNSEKLVKMALVHDLGEIETGDITPYDDKALEKRERERRCAEALLLMLNDLEFYELWMEYLNSASEEARFLKQLDKLEMTLQALDYEDLNLNLDLNLNFESFWDTARAEIKIPQLVELLKAIEGMRRLRR